MPHLAASFRFEPLHRAGSARAGRLHTPHGSFDTPAFVAVGTQATVKAMGVDDLQAVGTPVLFCNTYHLYLRPTAEVVAELGGLHRFMGWHGPIMTDSGGFQVFSLGASIEHGVGKIASVFPDEADPTSPAAAAGTRSAPADSAARRPRDMTSLVKITEEGVRFRSHLDGSRHVFTPELSIAVQRQLGADMILAFDECTSPLHDHAYTEQAMQRTHRWAERSLAAFRATPAPHGRRQALFGIIQGGAYPDLREASTRFMAELPFDGIAIGGSLGRTKADMHAVLDLTIPQLPDHKPRHLLGIGEIADVFEVVARGVDTFDCVAPTRMARNGALLARTLDGRPLPRFRLNLKNARYKRDPRPLEADCTCFTCRHHSRAYLHHLFRTEELLAFRLATIHNLHFFNGLMVDIRAALAEGRFEALRAAWLNRAYAAHPRSETATGP
jgi:tRNA-guanine transglycosylase